MKFMLLTIFFGAQSAFCAHNKQPQLLAVEKMGRKHDGPPLYCSDIYTNGKADKDRDKLLINIQKSFPLLTTFEIEACLRYCNSYNRETDLIAECQELEMWKAAHLEELAKRKSRNDSCFSEYLIRRD